MMKKIKWLLILSILYFPIANSSTIESLIDKYSPETQKKVQERSMGIARSMWRNEAETYKEFEFETCPLSRAIFAEYIKREARLSRENQGDSLEKLQEHIQQVLGVYFLGCLDHQCFGLAKAFLDVGFDINTPVSTGKIIIGLLCLQLFG
jgi:hypothetical protein